MPKDGPRSPELIERHIAMHDVAAGEAEFLLQVCRREAGAAQDRAAKVWRVFSDGIDHDVGNFLTRGRPVAVGEDGGYVLAEQAGDVMARRCKRVVER